MSDLTTKKLLKAYVESKLAHKPGFFTSFFTDVEFHNSAKVDLDVLRKGARIAPVIQSIGTGGVRFEQPKATNKEWEPPVYGLEFGLNAHDAMKRELGVDPYENPDFMANIQKRFMRNMPEAQEMIMRGVELQCTQAVTNGVLTLPDKDGNAGYTLDYLAQSSHKLVAPTADWDLTSGTDRLGDVTASANKVWEDSGLTPKYLILGASALHEFVHDEEVLVQTRKDGTGIGEQVPPASSPLRNGGVYHGKISAGNHVLEIWTTNSFYETFDAGTPTKFLSDWHAIVLGENAPLTLTYGGIPRLAPIQPSLQSLAVGRYSDAERKADLITNAWFSPDGTQLFGSVGARPLAILKNVDCFASINTKVT